MCKKTKITNQRMYNVVVSWKIHWFLLCVTTCWPVQDGGHVDVSGAVECGIYVHISMETNYNKVLHRQNYYCNSLVIHESLCFHSHTYNTSQCRTWRSIPHLSVLLTSIYHLSLSATFHYSFPYVQGRNNLTKHPALNLSKTSLNPYALAHVRQHWLFAVSST